MLGRIRVCISQGYGLHISQIHGPRAIHLILDTQLRHQQQQHDNPALPPVPMPMHQNSTACANSRCCNADWEGCTKIWSPSARAIYLCKRHHRIADLVTASQVLEQTLEKMIFQKNC